MPGPAADPYSRKSRSGRNGSWVELPPDGYDGPVPEWPLEDKLDKYQRKLWNEAWRTPQAFMWAQRGLDRVVARYVMCSALAERETTAAILAEVRQIEDRLGLSPMALRKLQWIINKPQQGVKLAEVKSIDRFADL